MISRHISIDEDYISKIKPYIEIHRGNLGAALKDIIYKVNIQDSNTNVDTPLFDWMIREVEDKLIPDNIIDKIIDPVLINSIEELEEYLNNRFNDLNWNINIELRYDILSNMLIEIRGDHHRIKFVSCIISQYLIRHSLQETNPFGIFGIKSVTNLGEYIRVELSKMDKKQSIESLYTFFGGMDKTLEIIKDKPSFWKSIIERHIYSSYKMVTVHRNYFEDILSNNISTGDIMIEALTKRSVQDIPLKELLLNIKYVYETSRVVDMVEIDDDDMILYHNYRDQHAIDKLKKILISLLDNSGHSYESISTSNMIILRHVSKISFDQELTQFTTFLNEMRHCKIGY